jgi:putative ubiquitin-RnfH superfamily antitoxin RatB of RatAB toxin-antitoxin module
MAEIPEGAGRLCVTVVFAHPEYQTPVRLELPPGSTVDAAIRASGLLEKHPEIDLAHNAVGLYGRRVRLDTVLREGDRVEIYRPLPVDPRALRQQRAAQNRGLRKNPGKKTSA